MNATLEDAETRVGVEGEEDDGVGGAVEGRHALDERGDGDDVLVL